MPRPALKPLVVDLPALIGSVNAAASALAAARHTAIGFDPFDSRAVVDCLAQAFTNEPGFPVVRQDHQAIEADRKSFASKYLRESVAAGAAGPATLTAYLTRMDQERRANLMQVYSVFNNVSQMEDEVLARMKFAMHTLLVIRFGATVGLAVIPVLPIFIVGLEVSAGASLVISLGYGLGQQALKDYHRDAPPNVVAFDATGEFAKAARDRSIDIVKDAAARSVATQSGLLDDAQRQIDTLSRRLGRGQNPNKAAQLTRRLDRAAASAAEAAKTLKSASLAKAAYSKLPIVFAVSDVIDAYREMKDEW